MSAVYDARARHIPEPNGSLPQPALWIEGLWLSVLPRLTRGYIWVDADGYRLFGSADHSKYLSFLVRGHQAYTIELFKQSVEPGMVVLNIGSYIGYYTLLAAGRCGPHGKVYTFEPDPRNYRFLVHNINLNGLRHNVVPIQQAVADRGGKLAFFLGADPIFNSLWRKKGRGTMCHVKCTTVDDMFEHQPIQVVKIAAQGGEVHVLKGMEHTLANSERVTMFVECSPSVLSSSGTSVDEMLAQLARLGFRVQVIDETNRRLEEVTDAVLTPVDQRGKRRFVNLYCTKAATQPESGWISTT